MTRARKTLRIGAAALLLLLVIMAILAVTPLPSTKPRYTTPEWIGPVQVVDVTEEVVLPDKALRVVGGRLAEIANIGDLSAAQKARMVGVGGAYVAPGLWDMHAVLTRYARSLEHPLYVASGVTRLRSILNCPAEGRTNLYACQSDKLRWNDEIRSGASMGAIVMGSGSYPINGPAQVHPDAPASYAAATPEQARQLVRLVASQPNAPDHIKTYDRLPRGSFFALMDEARLRKLEVSGHVPVSVRVSEASSAGLKAIAHARALVIGCSSREADIIRMRSSQRPAEEWMRVALRSQDPATCQALWRTLRSNATFVSPTLVTRYSETRAGLAELQADVDTLRATPRLFKWIWSEDTAPIEKRSPQEEALYQRFYSVSAARTAESEKAGVLLLVGSDTGSEWVAPGAGLHREMESWRRAGIPIPAILRAAMLNPAVYFGQEARFGQIAPGYVADLIFLGGNPLTDLEVVRTPTAVMQEGRFYDREVLVDARATAEKAAQSWRFPMHFVHDLLRNPPGFAS